MCVLGKKLTLWKWWWKRRTWRRGGGKKSKYNRPHLPQTWRRTPPSRLGGGGGFWKHKPSIACSWWREVCSHFLQNCFSSPLLSHSSPHRWWTLHHTTSSPCSSLTSLSSPPAPYQDQLLTNSTQQRSHLHLFHKWVTWLVLMPTKPPNGMTIATHIRLTRSYTPS